MTTQLPEQFNGVFHFTNFTEEEFKASWDGVEYTFPALSTVPLIIPTANPLETQNIRKKFAKKLAEKAFYGSDTFKNRQAQTPVGSGLTAAPYTDADLTDFVQRCLEPLAIKHATVEAKPKQAIKLRTDEKGKTVTKVVDEGESLVGEGTPMA